MMICVVVSGVDSRVVVQTSMLSVLPDQRHQSPRKLRRFRVSYDRPSSLRNNDDDDDKEEMSLSWLSVVKDREPTSTPPLTSPVVPSSANVDVVPRISRLDFFRRHTARSRPRHGYAIRQRVGSGSVDQPVWRLFDGSAGSEGGSRTGLRPQSVAGRPAGDSALDRSTSNSTSGRTSGRELKIAILASVVVCLFAGLALTLLAVWIRRRRRVLRTLPKLYNDR